MPVPFQLTKEPIYDHCFSHDRQTLAITKDSSVEIYNVSSNVPKLVTVLDDHDKRITAIDISEDGKILTCSEDRNAIVYTAGADGVYKPSLVLLRINRAATVARWSPNGLKFAVGSADRIIAVCYFEEENDWWVSKHIKKPIKSTILSLDWHPNNVLLACGSTDGHVRVFSSFIKAIDSKPAATVWGERLPFQTLCLDFFQYGGWIHDVKFSPGDASFLAYVNNSTLNVVYPSSSGDASRPDALFEVKTSFLTFNSLIFKDDSTIITAGHDYHPVVFTGDTQSGWRYSHSIDDPKNVQPQKIISVEEEDEINQRDALNMFRQMDLKGVKSTEKLLKTVHQNSITTIRPYSGNGAQVTQFSTSGNDGKVVIFDA